MIERQRPLEPLHLREAARRHIEVLPRPAMARPEHDVDSRIAIMEGLDLQLDLEWTGSIRHLHGAVDQPWPCRRDERCCFGRTHPCRQGEATPFVSGDTGGEISRLASEQANEAAVVARPTVGAEPPWQVRPRLVDWSAR